MATVTAGPAVDVVVAPNITIAEYFGGVSLMGKDLSACLVTVRSASEEAYQTPAFDEYVLVIEGTVKLLIGNGPEAGQSITVVAGQGAFLPKGLRVKWVWPGPCKYVPICLPAFSPENCGREEEEGNHLAKTSDAMNKLREMHVEADTARGGAASGSESGTSSLTLLAIGVCIGAAVVHAFRPCR